MNSSLNQYRDKGNEVQKMPSEEYIKLLDDESETKSHELITECLDYYSVNGVSELTEEQIAEFCRVKGLT